MIVIVFMDLRLSIITDGSLGQHPYGRLDRRNRITIESLKTTNF